MNVQMTISKVLHDISILNKIENLEKKIDRRKECEYNPKTLFQPLTSNNEQCIFLLLINLYTFSP